MENENGYIKLYRQLLDNPVITKNSDYLSVWVYLLLNATYKNYSVNFNKERITLQPGQLLTGRKKISEFLNITESKVQRILKIFENEHQIKQQTSSQNRLITIINWDKYQSSEHQNEQQKETCKQSESNVKETCKQNEHQIMMQNPSVAANSSKENNYTEQRVNNERTTSKQPVNTNKKGKKEKSKNNSNVNIHVNNKNSEQGNNSKNAKQEEMFEKPKRNEGKNVLFKNSSVAKYENFKTFFKKEIDAGVDVYHYYEVTKNWAESKGVKRKSWIAQAKNIMLSDRRQNKIKMVKNNGSNDEFLEFLKD